MEILGLKNTADKIQLLMDETNSRIEERIESVNFKTEKCKLLIKITEKIN